MKSSYIYPGEYVPSPDLKGLEQELKLSHLGFKAKPLINLVDTPREIKIEVALPGVKREDIFIYTRYNILSIMALRPNDKRPEPECGQIHEFDTNYFERHIVLPENADTDFISAEYKQGVLYVIILKNNGQVSLEGKHVVVY
jgi:HSP20 family protein